MELLGMMPHKVIESLAGCWNMLVNYFTILGLLISNSFSVGCIADNFRRPVLQGFIQQAWWSSTHQKEERPKTRNVALERTKSENDEQEAVVVKMRNQKVLSPVWYLSSVPWLSDWKYDIVRALSQQNLSYVKCAEWYIVCVLTRNISSLLLHTKIENIDRTQRTKTKFKAYSYKQQNFSSCFVWLQLPVELRNHQELFMKLNLLT